MKFEELKIGEKTYPVNMGFGTLSTIQRKAGAISLIEEYTTTEDGEVDLVNLAEIVAVAVENGYKAKGEDKHADLNDIGEAIVDSHTWEVVRFEFIKLLVDAVTGEKSKNMKATETKTQE